MLTDGISLEHTAEMGRAELCVMKFGTPCIDII